MAFRGGCATRMWPPPAAFGAVLADECEAGVVAVCAPVAVVCAPVAVGCIPAAVGWDVVVVVVCGLLVVGECPAVVGPCEAMVGPSFSERLRPAWRQNYCAPAQPP